MADLSQGQREYIEATWKNQWDSILQSQNQIIGWIFTLHGLGLAGLLTFAASKTTSFSVVLGAVFFITGLVLIMVYGTLMYYFESHHFWRFRNNVSELRSQAIDWSEFVAREKLRPEKYRSCEWLAWISAGCGLGGLIATAVAIL